MRQLILNRIEEIKKYNDDFKKDTMRWNNVTVDGEHISNADFSKLSDGKLLIVFERIIRRNYTQM